MAAERRHGAENDGLSANRTVLFRVAGAGTQAAPGRDDNGCCPLGL